MSTLPRDVYVKVVPALEAGIDWPCRHRIFCLVVFADSWNVPPNIQALGRFATEAVAAGARLVLTYGSAAELLHELFDEIIAGRSLANPSILKKGDLVLTVSLGGLPLREAVRQIFETYEIPKVSAAPDAPVVFVVTAGDDRLKALDELLSPKGTVHNR